MQDVILLRSIKKIIGNTTTERVLWYNSNRKSNFNFN